MLALFALAHAEDLYVTSNERDAAIFIDGVDTGYRTPATIRGLRPGTVQVTVEAGCSRGEALVTVLSGTTTRTSLVATEQGGSLVLLPNPATARLELDGAPFPGVPGVPVAVGCGEHTARATLDGYVAAVVTVEVGMGQDLSVPLNLVKLGLGQLDLSVTPRSATLFLDDRPVGSDAVTLPSVYQGVHTISAELDGYQSAKKQVLVEEGSVGAWHFDLARTSQKQKASSVTRLSGGTSATALYASAPAAAEPARDAAAEARAAEEAEAEARAAEEAEAEARAAAARKARDAAETEAEARAAAARKARDAAEAEARAAAEAEARAAAEAEARAAEEAEAEARAAAVRKARDAEARAATARTARDDDGKITVKPTGGGGQAGKIVGGVALLAAGAGSGVYSAIAYDSAAQAYRAYTAKLEGAGPDKQRQRLADAYYEESVGPRQTLFYASAVGSGLALVGGVVVLALDGGAPAFVPVQGGGLVVWGAGF